MSHLLKKNKKILITIKLVIFIPMLLLFFKTINIYDGNKLYYVLFSVISIYLIMFSFRKKSFFYENFLGTLILLGFWLKFSILFGLEIGFTEGINNNEGAILPKNYDDALMASTIGILGFISFGHIRELFFNYPQKIKFEINTELYQKYRTFILLTFFCTILIVCFSNFFFQIYQRGLIGQSYNFLINTFIKTSLLYFLTFCSAIILYFDLASYKKVSFIIILLIFFESFSSSLSMLSRGMIFNSAALLYALYKFSNKTQLKLNFQFFLKIFVFLIIIFYLSVAAVNYLRINTHKIGDQSHPLSLSLDKIEDVTTNSVYKTQIAKSLYGIYSLMLHRWVGIDAMILITKNKELLNFDLFKESLKEKFDAKSISFYENTFQIYPVDNYSGKPLKKGNTLPGLIAFLFFSGSYIFLFFMMMCFCFIASVLEYITFKSTFNNLLTSGLIGMVISYRFAHFGYLPARSYLLFGSIIGIIILFYLIKFFYVLYKKSNY